jgi:hypothetical protein
LRLAVPRHRFSDFTLSTRKRLLIPRYLDLLIFLVERRRDAVHRREIFDRVWSDVIVSDSALSQAIRTLRRTLGDDPREPRSSAPSHTTATSSRFQTSSRNPTRMCLSRCRCAHRKSRASRRGKRSAHR